MKAADFNLAEAYPTLNGQSGRHRGPHEAGSNDRYYGQPYKPNFTYRDHKFTEQEMTPEQRADYDKGYFGETERKDWGTAAPPPEEE